MPQSVAFYVSQVFGNSDLLAQNGGRQAKNGSRERGIRRPLILAVTALALLACFAAYVRLSWTYPTNSDGASIALQAWQMLHGNPLLRGWNLADVPFYTTELPQYMLVELAHGLNASVVHIAAAMTYTLTILLAALLARKRAAGLAAVLAAGIAAGIMLAPQVPGVVVLLSSPDHIGTSVPIMLSWLILDRAWPGWPAAVVVPLLLGWATVADMLVVYVAVVPLVLVVAFRAGQAVVRDRSARGAGAAQGGRGFGSALAALAGQRQELALAAGAVVAAIAARLVLRLIAALGGFTTVPPQATVAGLGHIVHHNVPVVARGLLLLFGADFVDYPANGFLVLHLAGVALAAGGVALTAWRFLRDRDLVAQLLLAGIVVNLAIFLASTGVSALPTTREVAVVLPFSAALAGRQLGPRLAALARAAGRPRAVAAGLVAALGLAGAGYAAGLVREIAPAVPPTAEQRLASWLEARHLDDGLSGYWASNVVTLTSGDRVRIRLAEISHGLSGRFGGGGPAVGVLIPGIRETDAAWYDPADNTASFFVLYPGTVFPAFTDKAAVIATFGEPSRTYHVAGYTILVWPHANLLTELGRPGQPGS